VRSARVLVQVAVCSVAVAMSLPGRVASAADDPRFTVRCAMSHRAKDDPIVHPGDHGASHWHDFAGNTGTDATSTPVSLRRRGDTTCSNPADRSAYWVPSLTVGGYRTEPSSVKAYYEEAGRGDAIIVAMPVGLRMIAGNERTTTPQPLERVAWDCGAGDDATAPAAVPPSCPDGELELHVRFPDCWASEDLDADDHRSHVAYQAGDGSCPPTHPVAIPRLRLKVVYESEGGRGAKLSSGSPVTAHADFVNAWKPAEQRRLLRDCILAGQVCDVSESRGRR